MHRLERLVPTSGKTGDPAPPEPSSREARDARAEASKRALELRACAKQKRVVAESIASHDPTGVEPVEVSGV